MRRGGAEVERLGRGFFARPTVEVARGLVGCSLHVDAGTPQHVVATIVEVEAYLGLDDPASHAYRGPTPRARIMFEAPGHLYVYLSRGIHHCANLVTESTGTAGAVLLRAAVVERGEEAVRARRGAVADANALLRGPGNLCRGLGLTLLDNGIDVCTVGSRVRVVEREGSPRLLTGRRVGINVAAERPLRFAWSGHPAVSSPVRE
jgi:DNA-3-methyladenine glycosylase